jgi:flavin-dependent dehydrogenase
MACGEVVVAGGGPAGAAAALLLARWAVKVRLVAAPPESRPALAVSLPPSTAKLWRLLGVAEAVAAAGFLPGRGNTVWWESEACRVEPFADGAAGWQLTLDALARVLLAEAQQAGVVVDARRATADALLADPAAFVIDATGRAGVLARRLGRREIEPAGRTVALGAWWERRGGWPLPDDSHTVVEAHEAGWAWSIPTAPGRRYLGVMAPAGVRLEHPGADLAAAYRAEVARARHLAPLFADATCVSAPTGWDATMYRTIPVAAGRVLVAGDAASFVDPLSSAGVRKALASGWLAAVAVHTALRQPGRHRLAFDYFAAREADVHARFVALTRTHLGRAGRRGGAFWDERVDDVDVEPAGEGSPEALRRDPRVAAAFAALRAAPVLAVQPGPALRVAPYPVVRDRFVDEEARLVVDAVPGGLRHLRGVDLLALIELAPRHAQVPDLYEAYQAAHGAVPLPDVLGALAVALAFGWLAGR